MHLLVTASVQVSVSFSTQVQMSPPKSILDPMASQTRSKLSIPDDAVTTLPGKGTKKPSDLSLSIITETLLSDTVPVDTFSFPTPGDNPQLSAFVPAIIAVDTTTTKPSAAASTFASASATSTTKDSADNDDDNKNDNNSKKPSNKDSADNEDKKNNRKKKSVTTAPHPIDDLSTFFVLLSSIQTLHVLF